MLETGIEAPLFCAPSTTQGGRLCLEDLKGKWVVLFFYPQDCTPD